MWLGIKSNALWIGEHSARVLLLFGFLAMGWNPGFYACEARIPSKCLKVISTILSWQQDLLRKLDGAACACIYSLRGTGGSAQCHQLYSNFYGQPGLWESLRKQNTYSAINWEISLSSMSCFSFSFLMSELKASSLTSLFSSIMGNGRCWTLQIRVYEYLYW